MSHPNITEMLTETVVNCFEQGRPFSGYNITLWTREREGIKLRHLDIQGDVHDLEVIQDALDYGYTMADGKTYSWTRSEFSNWHGPAFQVYHPVGYDINNFVPEGVQPVSQNVIAASVRPANMIGRVTPQADGTQPDHGGHQDDGTYKTDYRDRLMVPTKFLKDAGISAGDTVFVIPDQTNQTVFIAKDDSFLDCDSITISTQRVERNGDIRLSSRTLKSAGLQAYPSGNKFVIETAEVDGDNTKIKVVEIKQA